MEPTAPPPSPTPAAARAGWPPEALHGVERAGLSLDDVEHALLHAAVVGHQCWEDLAHVHPIIGRVASALEDAGWMQRPRYGAECRLLRPGPRAEV
ncbi:MAG TPA: hypothetical protein VFH47_08670 [Candidatus Thermoplasmatota archaeon]|nr:hypothetical protein [Candidatus Thermoplasmatota archaeon]